MFFLYFLFDRHYLSSVINILKVKRIIETWKYISLISDNAELSNLYQEAVNHEKQDSIRILFSELLN